MKFFHVQAVKACREDASTVSPMTLVIDKGERLDSFSGRFNHGDIRTQWKGT